VFLAFVFVIGLVVIGDNVGDVKVVEGDKSDELAKENNAVIIFFYKNQ